MLQKINSFRDLWSVNWETGLRFKVMRKKIYVKKEKEAVGRTDGWNAV